MWCEGLDFEDWEEKYDYDEKVMGYLHGNCEKWVIENYQEGDIPVAVLEDRESGVGLMHSFLKRNGMFLDIRGETEDFGDVLEAFDYGEYRVVEYPNLQAFAKEMNDIGLTIQLDNEMER
jgi:hypothetical protein